MIPPTQAGRRHQTEKPVELMRQLVRICLPGGMVCDPFCGSGTTIEAAVLEGYSAGGIECVRHHAEGAEVRLKDILAVLEK